MPTTIRTALSVLLLTGACLAQAPVIHINGSVWDGNGGPFLNGTVYHIISNGGACCLSVPAGRTLTIQPGAIVKIDSSILVTGQLIARRATFTSWLDDSAGGDSNGDGNTTTPARGDWSLIEIGGDALFEDCLFTYGGRSQRTIHHRNGSMTLRRCDIRHSGANAVSLSHNGGFIEDCDFEFCSGLPIDTAALRYLHRLRDNRALQCDRGEYVRITDGRVDPVAGPLGFDPRSSISGNQQFVLTSTTTAIEIRSGGQLSVPAGTVLKFERGSVFSFGDLQVQGTAARPVIFTALEDDAVGGDTNKDGNATAPSPGDWTGILLKTGSDASRIRHAIIRFGGNGSAGLSLQATAAQVADSVIAHSGSDGVNFRGSYLNGHPRLIRCRLENNAGIAVQDIPWQSLALSSGNTASGNTLGDHFACLPDRPVASWSIGPDNYPGPVLVVMGRTLLSNGGQVTLGAGTTLKFTNPHNSGFEVSRNGALRCLGTAREPVVMTSIRDDEVGGDTNLDGTATSPASGDWQGLRISDDRVIADSMLEHVRLRYLGSGVAAVRAINSRLCIDALRIESCAGVGLELGITASPAVNVVVLRAADDGLRILPGQPFDLLHATVTACAGFGVNNTWPSWTGAVRNSIAWNNASGNFGGTLSASNVSHSDGDFAGSNGNIIADPRFVAAASGDLRLAPNSPCLGRGELATVTQLLRDHDDFPRAVDHDLNGPALPDMGAHETGAYALLGAGQSTPGGTLGFAVAGPPGLSAIWLGVLDGGFYLPQYGVQSAGSLIVFLNAGALPVGQPALLQIPNDPGLVGLRVGVQGLGVPISNPAVGAFTDVWIDTLR